MARDTGNGVIVIHCLWRMSARRARSAAESAEARDRERLSYSLKAAPRSMRARTHDLTPFERWPFCPCRDLSGNPELQCKYEVDDNALRRDM